MRKSELPAPLRRTINWLKMPPHLKKILSAEGQTSPQEVLLLFDMASHVREGCIVEIGSYRGRSTIALALGSMSGSSVPVYAIEPHEPFTGALGGAFGPRDRIQFLRNVLRAGVGEVVRLVNLRSEAVSKGWDREIALLWIDGDHKYEAVERDFRCWSPFVVSKGLVAFHDSDDSNSGPALVISQAISMGEFREIQQVHRVTVLQKSGQALYDPSGDQPTGAISPTVWE